MSLTDFIYRCPLCGHDPLEGAGDRARCVGCGRRFERGGARGCIRVQDAGGSIEDVPAHVLANRLQELDGPVPAATTSDGRIEFESPVTARTALEEVAVRHRGDLLGFVEQPGREVAGVLRLADDVLQFVEVGGREQEWPLRDVRAVQTSSASMQISPMDGGVIAFRFQGESPRRWEELLKARLRTVWREEGRGEIFEFQPRIRAG